RRPPRARPRPRTRAATPDHDTACRAPLPLSIPVPMLGSRVATARQVSGEQLDHRLRRLDVQPVPRIDAMDVDVRWRTLEPRAIGGVERGRAIRDRDLDRAAAGCEQLLPQIA